MTAIAARVEQAIGALRERFLQNLPSRLDTIAASLESPAAREIERGFHSLRGTAATYGLYGIAAVAAEGEMLCMRGGDLLDETTRARLGLMVDHLRAVAVTWLSGRMTC